MASALPEWYEHHTPAALQALPPRPSAGSDKKRVAFAEAKTRTFDPKAPPCVVAGLEETVVCTRQDGAANAMDRFISSVSVFWCSAPDAPSSPPHWPLINIRTQPTHMTDGVGSGLCGPRSSPRDVRARDALDGRAPVQAGERGVRCGLLSRRESAERGGRSRPSKSSLNQYVLMCYMCVVCARPCVLWKRRVDALSAFYVWWFVKGDRGGRRFSIACV